MKKSKPDIDWALLKNATLLYVEDELDVHKYIYEFLKIHFKKIHSGFNGVEGLKLYREHSPDVVITDIRMPGMDGLEMAEKIKEINPDAPIIILSAFYETSFLMRAIDIGIDKYVRKPTDGDKLLEAIYKCALPLFQEKEIENLNQNMLHSLESRISKSPSMNDVIKRVMKVAASDFSVIIHGETGVGKSYISNIIHDLSPRANKPFVSVDIGAIPETLVESELFGHTKGAFTGADKNKKGFFEIAGGGTLLLEDLENMSPYAQSKLLRAVEDKKVYPLGSTTPIDVDIRLISATNKNIFDEVKKKNFREDLFYRLCEFDIYIPPMRERPEDISMLTMKFAQEVAGELDKKVNGISPDAQELLLNHYWKGNVREIKNVIRRAVLLCDEETISKDVISKIISRGHTEGSSFMPVGELGDYSLAHAIGEAEKTAIVRALRKSGGKKLKAASILKIDYKTLINKMEKHRIVVKVQNQS